MTELILWVAHNGLIWHRARSVDPRKTSVICGEIFASETITAATVGMAPAAWQRDPSVEHACAHCISDPDGQRWLPPQKVPPADEPVAGEDRLRVTPSLGDFDVSQIVGVGEPLSPTKCLVCNLYLPPVPLGAATRCSNCATAAVRFRGGSAVSASVDELFVDSLRARLMQECSTLASLAPLVIATMASLEIPKGGAVAALPLGAGIDPASHRAFVEVVSRFWFDNWAALRPWRRP